MHNCRYKNQQFASLVFVDVHVAHLSDLECCWRLNPLSVSIYLLSEYPQIPKLHCTAYISTVTVSTDSQVTLHILGLSEDDHLHIYPLSEYQQIPKLHCTSWDCPRMATFIYTPVRVSADSQVKLYILGLSEDGHLHTSEYPRIPNLHCTSWDCSRMATYIHTCCQSIR